MKVGILTFPNSQSYGATLQMYALQQAVKGLGHDVEVINYHSAYMRAEKHLMKEGDNPWRFAVQTQLRRWLHHTLFASFRRFERDHILLHPARPFTDKAVLTRQSHRYDAIICGSDQVWNPRITGKDMSYFLDFCPPEIRRVAYAPSFGFAQFSEDYYDLIRPELRCFSALSVREQSGKSMMDALVDVPVTVVADPTFLSQLSDWTALEKPHPAAEGDYILYFAVRKSPRLFRRCLEWAREKGMKVVVVGGRPWRRKRHTEADVEYAIDIGPGEWLYLMHHARYVMTNSFHGTAFSVIYQKDFYVEYPAGTGSRLAQVIEDLGMQSRVVQDGVPLTDAPAPHAEAQAAFAAMREQSLRYLADALG